ncbi:MAG: twin-arginine translocase TatA/TatE family subunit [Thermoleophilaceae bacterium]|nr:twin-arginine translocase TatA/TatE family subunit [Thermoleophilaceae bacterium]
MGFLSAPGPLEIMVILAVALIVLGPSRLPDAAKSVGRGMREFRESLSGGGDDERDYEDLDEDGLDGEDDEEVVAELDEDEIDPGEEPVDEPAEPTKQS